MADCVAADTEGVFPVALMVAVLDADAEMEKEPDKDADGDRELDKVRDGESDAVMVALEDLLKLKLWVKLRDLVPTVTDAVKVVDADEVVENVTDSESLFENVTEWLGVPCVLLAVGYERVRVGFVRDAVTGDGDRDAVSVNDELALALVLRVSVEDGVPFVSDADAERLAVFGLCETLSPVAVAEMVRRVWEGVAPDSVSVRCVADSVSFVRD